MMTYTEFVRRGVNRFKDSVISLLVRRGISANAITFIGFLLSCLAGVSFALGIFPLGGFMILFAGACDIFDGAVAKRTGTVSPFGGFLDSCLDRYSDVVLLGGAGFYYAVHGPVRNVALAVLSIGGSVLVSYARARAEGIGVSCTVGFWERAERTFMIMLGGFFWRMPGILWELAIFANITAAHRIYYTWARLHKPSWEFPRIPVLRSLLFWEYPRYTWQYDIYVGLGIVLPLIIRIR
ncbi:MAG: CDP-alcohol phosphatidyltransferase family protein [Candidatus Aureabacteria bacterium]|nr:CDP-alcohol phosphatidyltransferase family protein [Candidatus Auribacterota bacterium]